MSTKGACRGATIAAMAAGLFMAAVPMAASAKSTAKVHCEGVNSCKGKGACMSTQNSCKGQKSYKGKGFIDMTAKKCRAKGGTAVPGDGMDKK